MAEPHSTPSEAPPTFSSEVASPLPRHLLEQTYAADKATFLAIPCWTRDFVGADDGQLDRRDGVGGCSGAHQAGRQCQGHPRR